MRKRLIMAVCLLALPLIVRGTAFTADYSSVKGDYKILCLGDSRDEVLEKLDYLDSAGEIKKSRYFTANFFEVKGVFEDSRMTNVALDYYKDKLYQIEFWDRTYSALDVDGFIRHVIYNRLEPMFTDLYGSPTQEWKYPDFADVMKQDRPVVRWDLENKILTLLVEEYELKYGPVILIQDKKLLAQKRAEEEEKAVKMQEKTKSDF